jgi:hypothetical protein
MKHRAMLSCVAVAATVALFAAGCGSNSPSSPSQPGAVAVQGVVLGVTSAGGDLGVSANHAVGASGGKITVTVAGTSLTTTVSASGTFELNVAAGTFTLIFQKDGVEIGRVDITAASGDEVKIVVQVQSTSLTVIEIKVENKESETENETTKTCVIEGGKVGQGIEAEGDVSSGNYAAFKMAVNGQRSSALVDVSASSASFKCNGAKGLTADQCRASVKAGAKVHVRGTLMSCDTSAASITALEVMVQKAAGSEAGD